MRLRYAALFLAVLLFSGLVSKPVGAQEDEEGLKVIEADRRHLLIELRLPAFEMEPVSRNGIIYQRLQLPGWGYWGRPGYPRLPRQTVPVGLPRPGSPEIRIVETESEIIPVERIYPAPALVAGGTVDRPEPVESFRLDSAAYQADISYPGPLAEATDQGWLRDQPLFQLRLYPFQYNPARGELTVYRRIKVLITFPPAPLSGAETPTESPPPVFKQMLQQTLINYDSLNQAQPPLPPTGDISPLDAEGSYVIITHPDFYDAVQGLATYRAGQGESVVVVKTNDIYDQYNGGVKSPEAIRDFLAEAYATWSIKPVFLLLVGDASDDPDLLPDLLPAYYSATLPFGEAPNDAWYTKINGADDYPDLIVGRIPARSVDDVTTVAGKVQSYEQAGFLTDWLYRAVLVADDDDPAFPGDMEIVANLLPENVSPTKMYAYDPGTSVQDQINAGALVVAYSGHGSGSTKWGRWPPDYVRIYEKAEMPNLLNGDKLPFLTVANCRNGLFSESTRTRGMAEEFLLLNNKGGIAAWAPSSYAFPTIDTLLYQALFETLFDDDDLTLGSATTTARVKVYLDDPDLPLAHLETFIYFGDPATRLHLPDLPIEGLMAGNSSPVFLGQSTTLSATVTGGSHVVYTWDLGDGSPLATGASLQHTYPATGAFTAQVTATNNVSSQSISTTVTVEEWPELPIEGLMAGNSSPVFLGQSTTLSATITGGSHVVYTWDLGDGSPLATGASLQHTYPTTGAFIAIVTATNIVSSQSISTTVTVEEWPGTVYLPLVVKP